MDRDGRYAILKVHTRKLNIGEDLDLERVALITPGTSGADLSAIVNEGQGYHIYILHTFTHSFFLSTHHDAFRVLISNSLIVFNVMKSISPVLNKTLFIQRRFARPAEAGSRPPPRTCKWRWNLSLRREAYSCQVVVHTSYRNTYIHSVLLPAPTKSLFSLPFQCRLPSRCIRLALSSDMVW